MNAQMAGTCILNYMDKVALSEASVFGIWEDLVWRSFQPDWQKTHVETAPRRNAVSMVILDILFGLPCLAVPEFYLDAEASHRPVFRNHDFALGHDYHHHNSRN